MNFCSNCGSDQLEHRIPPGDNRDRFICPDCNTIHYTNPKVVTGCLPFWGNQILLCKRAIDPRKGYWNIPSGYMEIGETAEDGAIRELWEEAEARINIDRLLSIYSIPQIGQVYMHFRGELVKGEFGVGEESLETRLFTEAQIPWHDIAFHSSVFSLKRYFEDLRNGNLQTHYARHPEVK